MMYFGGALSPWIAVAVIIFLPGLIYLCFLLYQAQKYYGKLAQTTLRSRKWLPVLHYVIEFFTLFELLSILEEHNIILHSHWILFHLRFLYQISPYRPFHQLLLSLHNDDLFFLVPIIVMLGYTWWLKSLLPKKVTTTKKNNSSK